MMVPYNLCQNKPYTLTKFFNSTTMISEKQTAFRQEYRARIDGWYNGFVHVAVIYIIGLTAIWIYIQHLENVQWWEWLTIPVVGAGCNISSGICIAMSCTNRVNGRDSAPFTIAIR